MTQALPLRCVCTDAGIELESILLLRYVVRWRKLTLAYLASSKSTFSIDVIRNNATLRNATEVLASLCEPDISQEQKVSGVERCRLSGAGFNAFVCFSEVSLSERL